MLSIFTKADHTLWDVHLTEFAYAINTAVCTSTKYTSACLNFGREPRSIVTLRNELDSLSESYTNLTPTEWADRVKRLPAIYDLVKKNIEKANERQSKYYDRGRVEKSYKIGDIVKRKKFVLSSKAKKISAKLAGKFVGPCRVVKIISPVVYEVEDLDNLKVYRRHVDDLREFTIKDNKLPAGPVIQKAVSTPVLESSFNDAEHSYNLRSRKRHTQVAAGGPPRETTTDCRLTAPNLDVRSREGERSWPQPRLANNRNYFQPIWPEFAKEERKNSLICPLEPYTSSNPSRNLNPTITYPRSNSPGNPDHHKYNLSANPFS